MAKVVRTPTSFCPRACGITALSTFAGKPSCACSGREHFARKRALHLYVEQILCEPTMLGLHFERRRRLWMAR